MWERAALAVALALVGCDDGDRRGRGADATPAADAEATRDAGAVPRDASATRDAGPDASADAGPPADAAADAAPPADAAVGADAARPAERLTAGPATLVVGLSPFSLALERADEPRVAVAPGGLLLGTVPALDPALSYDPWPLLAEARGYQPPAGLTWQAATSAEVEDRGPGWLQLRVRLDGGAVVRLRLEASAADRFRMHLEAPAEPTAFFRMELAVDPQEGFYGLGEVFDDVNHRGHLRAMQLELDPELEGRNNEAHVPIPLLIGTRAWGVFVQSYRAGAFAVATARPDAVTVAYALGGADEGLTVHLLAAPHPLDVTRRYYEITGFPRPPAPWALGPLVWRDENEDQAQVLRDAETMRDLDLPASGYWIDRPYATAVNTFDFDARRFPDPAAMVARLQALGFRVGLWHTPYLDEQHPATAALRAEAAARGFYPRPSGLLLNGWSLPVDLSHPEARAWWQGLLGGYAALGIEGYKLDYGEDVVVGLNGRRTPWGFAGGDERTMHARYQLEYHRTYAEVLPPEGGYLLCRGGTFGTQTLGVIIWPGDLDADFTRHRERVDGRVSVGGLPAALIAGLSLGPSGLPFYGSDTGGYRHAPPDKEVFTRWFQITALSTVMQIGTNTNDVAWEPTPRNGFDQEMLGWYRTYTRLHLRLFPYLWSHTARLAVDGRPIQRALGLAHPEMGEHPSDTFLLGDDLLVAPVVERGAREREVHFPPGRSWVDWWTGATYAGGARARVPAPLSTLPLFLGEGGIVPLLRPTIDTLAPVAEADRADSFINGAGPLWARVVPGPASTFELYDGARLSQAQADGILTLGARDGDVFDAGVRMEVHWAGAAPAEATLGAAPLPLAADRAALDALPAGYHHDPAARTLHVKLPPGNAEARFRSR